MTQPATPAAASPYSITHVNIKNFRGIEFLDLDVPPGGIIAAGPCDSGKTSLLNAVHSALAAQDIGADAIRIGADKAEITIDMGALSVRRVINRTAPSTVTVHENKMKATSPVAFLRKLLGSAAVDPLDLLKAKEKDRREIVLSAIPATVTPAQLAAWAPGLPTNFSTDGHGLEVIRRAHEYFYEQRAAANAAAKAANAEAERLGRLVQATLVTMPLGEARTLAVRRAATLADLEGKARAYEETQERTKASRARIAELRDEAARADLAANACPVGASHVELAKAACDDAAGEIKALEAKLAAARERLAAATEELKRVDGLFATSKKLLADAEILRGSARQLEDALASAIAPEVPPTALAAAVADVEASAKDIAQAEEAERREKARAEAATAADRAAVATAAATDLDRIVKRLDAAPAELLASAQGIPGLSLLGDDIALNGVAIGKLCGKQQMHACVEISRLLNPQSKLTIVDRLESLNSSALAEFLTIATRDGWQVIGSRVDDDERRFIAVQATPVASEAAELAMTPDELAALAALAFRIVARRAGVVLAPDPVEDDEREAA